jgi:hypothetical protein
MSNEVGGLIDIREVVITNKVGDRTFDLTDVFVSFTIYEDLFLPFKTGRLIIKDTNELQTFLPIIGGEKVEVTYKSRNDDVPKVFKFYVYKLEKDLNITTTGNNMKTLVMFFSSNEQIMDSQLALSKKFKAKADVAISDLLTTYLKSNKLFEFDSTDEEIELVANFWRPSKIINYLSSTASNSNLSDFIFFEDKDGFKFKSISNLMKEAPAHEVEFVDDLSTQWDMNKFQRYAVSKHFNLLEMGKIGAFGNTVFQFDNEKYDFTKHEEDFETVTSHGTSLGQNVQMHEDFVNNNSIITTYKDSKKIAFRDQLLKSLSKYHVIIQLTGDSSKTIGQVINVNMRTKVRGSAEPHMIFNGPSLVTNIKHEINTDGTYLQNIKVVKNAFFKINDTSKVKGNKNV